MTALELALDDVRRGAAARERERGNLRMARARELVELLDVVRRRRGSGNMLDQVVFFELDELPPCGTGDR